MSKNTLRPFLLTTLASVWFILTIGIICWWWFYSMKLVTTLHSDSHVQRMFLWEGSFLLGTTFVIGAALIVLTYRDQRRHRQLQIFFANFSHDIKTSISRLRLQSELFQEDHSRADHPELFRLLENISRLDLQLENSLYLANLNESRFHLEPITLGRLLESLRSEWQDVQFSFHDIGFHADRRALISVFRNIFANAVIHSKATEIRLQGKMSSSKKFVEIEITSNGDPFVGDIDNLGREPLHSKRHSTQGNGLGLFLSMELLRRMGGGSTRFSTTDTGALKITLSLPNPRSQNLPPPEGNRGASI